MSNFISEFLNTATETDISPEWLINKIGNNNLNNSETSISSDNVNSFYNNIKGGNTTSIDNMTAINNIIPSATSEMNLQNGGNITSIDNMTAINNIIPSATSEMNLQNNTNLQTGGTNINNDVNNLLYKLSKVTCLDRIVLL